MDLNQVTAQAVDLPASIQFYKDLGLILIVESANYARFECPQGNSTFSLHASNEARPPNTIIYFEVSDLGAKVAELESRGLRFSSEPTKEPWLWHEARLLDPSGNQLCIYNAGKNRKNPPWRIAD